MAFLTAPSGRPIFFILKYFWYNGSSLMGTPFVAALSDSVCDVKLLSGSRSKTLVSTPSLAMAFLTAPSGKPIFFILKYFWYKGSSLMGISSVELLSEILYDGKLISTVLLLLSTKAFGFRAPLCDLSVLSAVSISCITFLMGASVASLEMGDILSLAMCAADNDSFTFRKSFNSTPGWSNLSSNSIALLLSGCSIGTGAPRFRLRGITGNIGRSAIQNESEF